MRPPHHRVVFDPTHQYCRNEKEYRVSIFKKKQQKQISDTKIAPISKLKSDVEIFQKCRNGKFAVLHKLREKRVDSTVDRRMQPDISYVQ